MHTPIDVDVTIDVQASGVKEFLRNEAKKKIEMEENIRHHLLQDHLKEREVSV